MNRSLVVAVCLSVVGLNCATISRAQTVGRMYVWGYNVNNQCTVPAEVQNGISDIAAGHAFCLAAKSGRAYAWGTNDYGQCNVPDAAKVGVLNVSAGMSHCIALSGDRVVAWGSNLYGERDVPNIASNGVSQISAGGVHNLALRNGRVIAWGNNGFGQINVPADATSGVSQISAGGWHSLALKEGHVIAWGKSGENQLNIPADATNGVSQVSAGSYYSMALKDGRVIVWGSNAEGQRSVPADASNGVTQIAASGNFCMALKNGKIITWGANNYGQLNVPQNIQSNVTQIAGFEWQALALVANNNHYVVKDNPGAQYPYTNWQTAAATIQAAVNAGEDYDIVLVSNGVYNAGTTAIEGNATSNRVAITNRIVVKSVNGPAVTVIEGVRTSGDSAVRGVFLTTNAMVAGFTIQNGGTKNSSVGADGYGAGVFIRNAGTISNCIITKCYAYEVGGAAVMHLNAGLIIDSTLVDNVGRDCAGGVEIREAPNAVIDRCIIVSNRGERAVGGVKLYHSGTVKNSLIAGNTTVQQGGGVHVDCSSGSFLIENCTVVGNYAAVGGGVRVEFGTGIIKNSIIQSNATGNLAGSCTVAYSCVSPAVGGAGNISADPQFMDATSYRLKGSSPCINTGTNQPWMVGAVDLYGNPRILAAIVDMGAHEFGNDTRGLSAASPYGTATPSGTNWYLTGAIITNSSTALDTRGTTQYVCAGWAMPGQEPQSGTTNQFVMTLTNNAALNWLWTTNVQFTRTAGANGSISGPASGWYALGGSVTVTAVPDANYHFTGWSGATNGCVMNGNVIVANMTQARSIAASFAIDQHTLTVTSPYGTPSPGTQTADYGTLLNQTINSPANNGYTQYVCAGAAVTGNAFTQNSPTSVSLNLTNHATLAWQWTTNVYLTLNPNGAGSIGGAASGWYAMGGSVTVTAAPNAHCRFTGWSGDVQGDTNSPVMSLTMNRKRNVTANFAQILHTVSVQASPAAWGTVSGGGTIWEGQTVQILATPNWGRNFKGWQDGALANPRMVLVTGAATYVALFGTSGTNYTANVHVNPVQAFRVGAPSYAWSWAFVYNYTAANMLAVKDGLTLGSYDLNFTMTKPIMCAGYLYDVASGKYSEAMAYLYAGMD